MTMIVSQPVKLIIEGKYKYCYMTDFFPPCVLPDCPDVLLDGHVHRHILPIQQQILNSTTKYLYMQGGVGGGKTVGIACKVVLLSLTIPKNRWVISRYHYDDLFDSSWREINDCIQRLVDQNIIPNPHYSKKTGGAYTQIDFPWCGSELKAVQGKNWRRGLGASHGGFWVDDALECEEQFFVGTDVSAGLMSRMRLPHVHFDPETYDATNREHGSLQGIVSTNPPPVSSFLHRLFGTKPGIHKIGNDTVEWILGKTTDNVFVGADYAKGLMAIQTKMGRKADVVRRIICGESLPAYGGVPVFPDFDHAFSVAPVQYKKELPLVCGWDFGFHHPAVVCSNLYKCKYEYNHYICLSEVAKVFSIDTRMFWTEYVEPHIKALYADCCLVLHAGDRAGYRLSDSDKDRRGPIRILRDEYHLDFRFRFMHLEPSLDYMRNLLKLTCKCGMAMVLISPDCELLIGALEGGYKYGKKRDGTISEKPVEDRYFADTACAWRYGAENFVKWGVPHEYRDAVVATKLSSFRTQQHAPWDWMTMSDQQFAEVLTK